MGEWSLGLDPNFFFSGAEHKPQESGDTQRQNVPEVNIVVVPFARSDMSVDHLCEQNIVVPNFVKFGSGSESG